MKNVRHLLAFSLALGGSLAAQTLPNRVAAGDVTQNSAVIWARSTAPGFVLFEVSADPTFQSGVQERGGTVVDATLPLKRRFGDLRPGTTMHYRVTDSAGAVDTGVFRTPHARGTLAGLHFGVSGDTRGDVMPFASVANVPARQLDFFAHLGDTVYADIASPIAPGLGQATTIAEFRLKHHEVYSDLYGPNFMADLRASTALLVVTDDHEVTNDYAGGAHPSTDLRFDQTGNFINETQLFANGMQVFDEYNPTYPAYYGDTGDPRTAFKRKLYSYRTYGQDAAVILLDARSFRDEPLPAADISDPLSTLAFLIAAFDPTRTMLGRVQVDDLKTDLLVAQNAGIVWKFVMVPEPIQNLSAVLAEDRFEGYAAERAEILHHIHTNGIDNVVFVAADIHGTIVNNLIYNMAVGETQIQTNAFEVTTGAIAFDAPFGPTVVGIAFALGFLNQTMFNNYNASPVREKDEFVNTFGDFLVLSLGYDALGLEGSPIDAQLLFGGYVAVHTYGWTEFEIDAATSDLTVTTWGLLPGVTDAPRLEARFLVHPQ